ncbi:MAG: hypothetical protein RIT81_21355 [Deltaproteobacteria bacterium]
MAPERVAYIAQGELFAGPVDGPLDEVPTKFVDQYVERSRRSQARNAWKFEQRDQAFLGGAMLWGGGASQHVSKPAVVSAARGRRPGELIYVVQAERVSSVFANTWTDATLDREAEVRLSSHNDLSLLDIAAHPDGELIACSVLDGSGAAHLAVTDDEGRHLRTITEGDSEDLSPRWHPRIPRTLVYQSAGIARSPEDVFMGFGPSCIEQLKLDTAAIDTLVEDADHDCFAPTFGADDALFYLRRPHHPIGKGASFGASLTDAFLAPFRIVLAGAAFLGVFAARYGKSLSKNSDEELARMQHIAARRRVSAVPMHRAYTGRPSGRDEDDPWRVPVEWKLMRRRPGGEDEVVAERVLDYDHTTSGAIVYTDGKSLLLRTEDGATKTLAEKPGMQRVVTL